ncbi:MAG: hypothetical protein DI616_15890 [Paracoccus denitrificans]|uniref:Uncharacterized protein n=1 Tax=Paracoccus denitrificans TaxID=266 RepID=A0A533I667_PARDE|nr:MAG: hypothetical protein DI616_15890 [Paracoccus denitrificans]
MKPFKIVVLTFLIVWAAFCAYNYPRMKREKDTTQVEFIMVVVFWSLVLSLLSNLLMVVIALCFKFLFTGAV